MNQPLGDDALKQIFTEARTFPAWQDKPVPEDLLRKIYDLARWGPTSANGTPARVIFVTSKQARERLIPCLMPGNVEKVRNAPVTMIVAWDQRFYEQFPRLWPHSDMKSIFVSDAKGAEDYAFRNSSLQGAYLILAARAMGLDCGPMSGFSNDKLNAEFFPDGKWKANFICNLGYGDRSQLKPRGPRFDFDEVCKII